MSEGVLIAFITGGLSFLGVVITNLFSSKKNATTLVTKIQAENTKVINDIKLEITAYHASTDEKIKTLTEEVKRHNNFAQRMPVVENNIKHINDEIKKYHS